MNTSADDIHDFLITKLTTSCNERYQHSKCWTCSYRKNCPHDCGKCLHYVHTPSAAPAPRKYDCGHMMDYYVCKYSHKYMSEMIYALRRLKDSCVIPNLKVLSIGCGPCTDLMALDYLKRTSEYQFSSLEYRGVEIDPKIWRKIYDDINSMKASNCSFSIIDNDICRYIDVLLAEDWYPDLIILQYVFSDMQKHSLQDDINHMISSMGRFIDMCPQNTYIVCNDINLSKKYNGGREYFDELNGAISSKTMHRDAHFRNSYKTGHFNYGREYECNDLILSPSSDLEGFGPYMSCASAQKIIKKVI